MRTAQPIRALVQRSGVLVKTPNSYYRRSVLQCVSVRNWEGKHEPWQSRRRLFRRQLNKEEEKAAQTPLPQFDELNNRFMKKVHPDQLVTYGDEYARINSQSWSIFQQLLQTIHVNNQGRVTIPSQGIYKMEFYVRPEKVNKSYVNAPLKPKKVVFNLRMSGLRCPTLMKSQFEELFAQAGIYPNQFEWGNKYWRSTDESKKKGKDEQLRKEDEPQYEKDAFAQETTIRTLNPRVRLRKRLKFWENWKKKASVPKE